MSALSEPEEVPQALPLPSRLHIRSCSASSVDNCDDESAVRQQQAPGTPTAQSSRHSYSRSSFPPPPPPLSVKDTINFWKQSEREAAAADNSSSNSSRSPQQRQHEDDIEHEGAAGEVAADSGRRNVKAAFLHRLQLVQAEQEEERRRHHDSSFRSEMQTAKEAKIKAQESLQLRITVDSAFAVPAAASTAAGIAATLLPFAPSTAGPPPSRQPPPPPPSRGVPAAPAPPSELESASFSSSPPVRPSPPLRSPLPLSFATVHPISRQPPPIPDFRLRSHTIPAGFSPASPPSSSVSRAHSPSPSVSVAPLASFPAGTDNPAHRMQIVSEIISSEQSYVSSLSRLISCYLLPLRAPPYSESLTAADLSCMFGGVELLHQFHEIFLHDLQSSDGQVAAVILRLCDFLKLYTQYLQNYPAALAAIDGQRKNKAFQSFLATQRKLAGTLDLMSYLIMPVQRVPRYELLLRELMRYTPAQHAERETLCAALSKMQAIAQRINDSQRVVEEMSKLVEVAAKISGDYHDTLLMPHRRLVKEGSLLKIKEKGGRGGGGGVLRGGAKGGRLYVFTDLILWTSDSGRYRGHARADGMRVEDWKDAKGRLGFAVTTDSEDGGTREMLFICATEKESEGWREAISEQCEKATERKRSSSIRQSVDLNPAQQQQQSRQQSVSVSVSASSPLHSSDSGADGSTAPFVERRVVRPRRSRGRETHSRLMESLKELRMRSSEQSRCSKSGAGGEEEEKEGAGSGDDDGSAAAGGNREEPSRVRRRDSFTSVSMSVSSMVAAGSEDD